MQIAKDSVNRRVFLFKRRRKKKHFKRGERKKKRFTTRHAGPFQKDINRCALFKCSLFRPKHVRKRQRVSGACTKTTPSNILCVCVCEFLNKTRTRYRNYPPLNDPIVQASNSKRRRTEIEFLPGHEIPAGWFWEPLLRAWKCPDNEF